MIKKETIIKYDLSLLIKILKKRGIDYPKKEIIKNHWIFKYKLKSMKNGKTYIIESVQKCWLFGYYYAALIECDNSHALVIFSNENCDIPEIKESINDFRDEFILI